MLQYWPLSFQGFVASCTLSSLRVDVITPWRTGSNCLVFMWLQVTLDPRSCWPRHFSSGLPSVVAYHEVGERIGGWVNDVKTITVICLNAGWWWWLVASWCWVDLCWPVLHYGALTCGTYCVIVTNPLVLKKPSCKHCCVLLGQWEGTGHGRTRSVGTEGPINASSNHTYPRNDKFANIII